MFEQYQQFISVAGFSSMPPALFATFVLITIWSLIWKGIALWKAAQDGSKPWFVALLVINTVGILEIVYIFFFSKKKGLK